MYYFKILNSNSFFILRKIYNKLFKFKFAKSLLNFIFTKFFFLSNQNIYYIKKIDNLYLHSTVFVNFFYYRPIRVVERFVLETFPIFFHNYLPKKKDVIIDLGSGIGQEVIIASRLIGEKGKLIAIEANDQIFKILEKNVTHNKLRNVTLINRNFYEKNLSIGIDRKEKNIEVNDDWTRTNFLIKKNKVFKSITLDEVIKLYNLKIINFARFNIEGAEKFLLKGNSNFLKIVQNLSISAHDFLKKKKFKTYNALIDFLEKKNFYINVLKNQQEDNLNYMIYASKEKIYSSNYVENYYHFYYKRIKPKI
jgi:FkbM family methyltransferase